MSQLIFENNDFFSFETKFSYEKHVNGLVKIDNPKDDNSFTLKFLAKGPEFDIVSLALEESTYINHITGKPFIRSSVLYKQLFKEVVVDINFPDQLDLDSIDVASADLNKINYNLVKIIMKEWLKKVI
jgi:hypothetical protein